MRTTTPSRLSSEIRELCARISKEEPVFVNVSPQAGAQIDQCFWNVRDTVRKLGGKKIFGWCIWEYADLFWEAEHHSVWLKPSGGLIDVTPKKDNEPRILFLPDKKAGYNFKEPKQRPNIFQASKPVAQIEKFLAARSKLQKFECRHSRPIGRGFLFEVLGQKLLKYEELKLTQQSSLMELSRWLKSN